MTSIQEWTILRPKQHWAQDIKQKQTKQLSARQKTKINKTIKYKTENKKKQNK
jgi:hypothetical protein